MTEKQAVKLITSLYTDEYLYDPELTECRVPEFIGFIRAFFVLGFISEEKFKELGSAVVLKRIGDLLLNS